MISWEFDPLIQHHSENQSNVFRKNEKLVFKTWASWLSVFLCKRITLDCSTLVWCDPFLVWGSPRMSVLTKKKPHRILSEASRLLKGGVTSFRQPRFCVPIRLTVWCHICLATWFSPRLMLVFLAHQSAWAILNFNRILFRIRGLNWIIIRHQAHQLTLVDFFVLILQNQLARQNV